MTLHTRKCSPFFKLFFLVDFSRRERQEHAAFEALLSMVPNLIQRLADGSEEEVSHIAAMVTGSSCSNISVR